MGSDIHMFVERLNPDRSSWATMGKWMCVSRDGEDVPPSKGVPDEDEDTRYKRCSKNQWHTYRNYGLFAILANVRNNYGFACIPMGSKYNPISLPKGFPEDASKNVAEYHELWGCDAHSATYLTLRELVEFDWDQVVHLYGTLHPMDYAEMIFQSLSKPYSYCGSSSYTLVSEDIMKTYLKTTSFLEELRNEVQFWEEVLLREDRLQWRENDQKKLQLKRDMLEKFEAEHDPFIHPYRDGEISTRIHWDETYSEVASSFLEEIVPALKKLGDLDEVRIVFFFDN